MNRNQLLPISFLGLGFFTFLDCISNSNRFELPKKQKNENPAPVPAVTSVSGGEDPKLNVLMFGDFGKGSSQQFKLAKQMKNVCSAIGCDFGWIAGDNIYNDGITSTADPKLKKLFEDPYGPLGIEFYLALGNHDYRGNVQAEIDYTNVSKIWKMPDRYYEKSFGIASLFVIDTNDWEKNDKQKEWLKQSLVNSKSNWKIVMGHHPVHSGGMHGDSPSLINSLLPLLCNYADFYLAGHEHDLQYLKSDCGVGLVISGAAGEIRKTKKTDRSQFAASSFGFSHLSFLDAQKVEIKYFGESGEVLYSVVEQKRVTPKGN